MQTKNEYKSNCSPEARLHDIKTFLINYKVHKNFV